MAMNRYTIIVHPNTLEQIELALGRICAFTMTADSEGANVYEVTQVHQAELTFEQAMLLDTAASVRFIAIRDIAPEPLTRCPLRSPVKPAAEQNLQELRKFLRMDRRARQ